MRTAIIVGVGLTLQVICPRVMRLAGGVAAALPGTVLWWGIHRAGCSPGQALPIFLLIFVVPAVVAVFVKYRWLNAP